MEEQQSLAGSAGVDGAEKPLAEQEPTEIKPKKRDIHTDMQHEPCCFTCGKEDEDLIPCSFCPKTFHAECLPVGTKITAPRWGCPSHKCMVCGAATSKSRGKIYRCAYCPSAYCFTHLPVDSRVFPTNPLEKYGYHTTSFFFINCPPCLERRRAQSKQEPGAESPDGAKPDVDSGEGELLIFIRKRKRTARSSTGGSGDSPSGTEQPPPAKKAKTERNEVDPLTPNLDLIYSLRRLMHVNRVSQKQVAKDLRVSESTLSAFMNEKSRISGWIEFEDRVRKWLTAHGEHMIDYELEKKREYSEANRLKLESQLYSGNHFTNIHPEVQQQLASSFTPANSNNYSQSVHLQPYRVNLQNGFSADEHSYNHESMHSTHAPNMSSMNSAHQQHMNSVGMTAANNVQPNYYHSFVPPQHQFNSVHGNFNPMYPVPHMPTPLHLVPTPSYPPQFFDPLSHGHTSHSPNGFKPDSSHMHSASNSLPLLAHMNNLPHPNPYQANTSAPKGNFVANNMQQTSSLTTMISQSTNSTNHTTNSNPASAHNHNQFPFSIQPTLDTRKNGSSFGMSPSLPFAPPAPGLSSLSSYSSATSSAAQQMTVSPNFDRQLPPVPRMLDPLLNRPGPAFMPPHPRPSEIWK